MNLTPFGRHYNLPELLSFLLDRMQKATIHQRVAQAAIDAVRGTQPCIGGHEYFVPRHAG